MVKTIRVAAAQTVEFVGEVEKASVHAINLVERSKEAGSSLICFPEGYLQGYIASVVHIERFALSIDAPEIQDFLSRLPENSPTVVLGFIEALGGGFSNCAAIIQNRQITGCYRKTHLLARENMFMAGEAYPVFEADGLRFGVNICYDANFPEAAQSIRDQGAKLLVCCANNMLPRTIAEKWKNRHNSIRGQRCRETGLWLLSSDVTGCRDECVAWGPTSLLDPSGRVVQQLPLDEPGLLLAEVTV
ncbi:carbon-nitrogen hydrolase family protein [Ponticaulis sp.]|uniref:carbon-nitrogen hydrolase family protein n=1 Tax=Ponticaulis sp. TaxID=2020902 RepID=UPI0025F18481|nr:carbon-nitrogen hydrolase family protein [Ponticaulis sp.]|tara:strand:+ start:1400 stop:2137 length:738 start_codon:yes stop_codon:yes gene_type:complete